MARRTGDELAGDHRYSRYGSAGSTGPDDPAPDSSFARGRGRGDGWNRLHRRPGETSAGQDRGGGRGHADLHPDSLGRLAKFVISAACALIRTIETLSPL